MWVIASIAEMYKVYIFPSFYVCFVLNCLKVLANSGGGVEHIDGVRTVLTGNSVAVILCDWTAPNCPL